jgi:hypothetical protein
VDNTPVFERQWTGMARPGEKLLAALTIDARDEVPTGARLDEPQALSGEPPGRFIYP